MSGSRELNSPSRFEREKVTRIRIEDLQSLNLYTLRLMAPPEADEFARDITVCYARTDDEGNGFYNVIFTWFVKADRAEVGSWMFDADSFAVILDSPEEIIDSPTVPTIQMGYFVGSTDPLDLELAALVDSTTELTY